MKELQLLKGKKLIASYSTAYDAADDAETLQKCFGANAAAVQRALRQNAFGFCIIGAKMTCCGYKYIIAER